MADFTNAAWRKSTTSSDGQCVEIAFVEDSVGVRDSKNPSGAMLEFNPGEWTAFLEGVRAGEFDK